MNEPASRGVSQLPTMHRLRAALRAARVLNPDGTSLTGLREAYVELPSGGVFYGEDLIAGEGLLRSARLAIEQDGALRPSERLLELLALDDGQACELLLTLLLVEKPPLWLEGAARNGELRAETIPEEAMQTLSEVLPDPDRREALLLALAQRHDDRQRAALGALGEEHVVIACQDRLRAAGHDELVLEVRQVSKISDQLGYDVTERGPDGGKGRYEVKTTRAVGAVVEIHISRNEARTGLHDGDWALVLCRADHEDKVSVIGWCRAGEFEQMLPEDAGYGGRWESAAIRLDVKKVLCAGLPPLP